MSLITAWIFSFILAVATPGRPQHIPEAVESIDDGTLRLQSIADDIATVVWDENEKPIFKDSQGRARTAAVLLSIILYESTFRKDVDTGVGAHARGDGGKSWCLMQINIGKGKTKPYNTIEHRFALPVCKENQGPCESAPKTPIDGQRLVSVGQKACKVRYCDPANEVRDGYSGEELVTDRKLCISEGLHILQTSLCTALPVSEWLRSYASGSCEKGSEASQIRMHTAINWFNRHRPQFTDEQVLKSLQAGDEIVQIEKNNPLHLAR